MSKNTGSKTLKKHWDGNYIAIGLVLEHRFDIEEFAAGTYGYEANREHREEGYSYPPLIIDYPKFKED